MWGADLNATCNAFDLDVSLGQRVEAIASGVQLDFALIRLQLQVGLLRKHADTALRCGGDVAPGADVGVVCRHDADAFRTR